MKSCLSMCFVLINAFVNEVHSKPTVLQAYSFAIRAGSFSYISVIMSILLSATYEIHSYTVQGFKLI